MFRKFLKIIKPYKSNYTLHSGLKKENRMKDGVRDMVRDCKLKKRARQRHSQLIHHIFVERTE